MARRPVNTRPSRPSNQRHDVPNPLGPSQGEMERLAGVFHDTSRAQKIARGTVISVDAARHTYRVVLNSGVVLNGVARLRSSLGDTAVLPINVPVMVTHGLGEPYILGVLPYQSQTVAGEIPDNVTGTSGHGGEDPVLNRNFGTVARAPGEPRDLLPGDVVHRSPDGAAIGALHGKLAVLRGGPLAQVRAHGNEDLVEVIAGALRTVTWMGESRVLNDDGKTSFVWRGGADQLTESGADEGAYTLRLDAGHTGDVFNFEVTTPQGQSLFRFHVDALGHLSLTTRGGWDWTSGSDRAMAHPLRVQGAQSLEVEGTQAVRVAGDATHAFQSNRAVSVSTNETLSVGQDQVTRVNRDRHENIGGVASQIVTGDVTRTIAEGNLTERATAGSASLRAATACSTTCDGGDITETPTRGRYRVVTSRADSIELGDGPASHGTKYEELAAALDALVADYNELKTILIAHVHPGAVPSPTLATQTPYSADWSPAKALVVKLK